jgi:hypothetical protein
MTVFCRWNEYVFCSPNQTFINLGKRVLFLTSMPFYWLIFFTFYGGGFHLGLFVGVIVASVILSSFGQGWGLLDFLSRG